MQKTIDLGAYYHFSDDFVFCGNLSQKIQQVGNAIPPKLAEAVALHNCDLGSGAGIVDGIARASTCHIIHLLANLVCKGRAGVVARFYRHCVVCPRIAVARRMRQA